MTDERFNNLWAMSKSLCEKSTKMFNKAMEYADLNNMELFDAYMEAYFYYAKMDDRIMSIIAWEDGLEEA